MALIHLRNALLVLGLIASALAAGFFYAYSFTVMPGLAASDPSAAIRAMQGVNAEIRTPVFAFAFFGALVFPALAAATALGSRPRHVAVPAFLGALIYGLSVVAVTFAFNVPLNEALATVVPTPETAAETWRGYAGPWTWWNHLRSLASLLSFALSGTAVVLAFRRPGGPGR